MKTIKHIILAISFILLVSGGLFPSFGQGEDIFYETYTRGEVISALDPSDRFFTLVTVDPGERESAVIGVFDKSNRDKVFSYLEDKSFLKKLPVDLVFAPGPQGGTDLKSLYALKLPGSLKVPRKSDIQTVTLEEGNREGTFDVLLSFKGEGGDKWAALTRANQGRSIAIVIGEEVVSAPRVMAEIKFGKCRISGNFSISEATRISNVLME